MHHSTSGKNGFNFYTPDNDIDESNLDLSISTEILIKILNRENELRLSKEIQDKYSKEDSLDNFERVTNELQIQALNEFNYDQKFLKTLRKSREKYCYNPLFKNITVYFQYDRSKSGWKEIGDDAHDVELVTLEGEKKIITILFHRKTFGSGWWILYLTSIPTNCKLYAQFVG